MGYGGGGVNGALRWRDLALDELLPVDEEKEAAFRAMQARKMASGTSNHNPQPHAQQLPPQPPQDQTIDEEEEEEEDGNNDIHDDDREDEDDNEESESYEE